MVETGGNSDCVLACCLVEGSEEKTLYTAHGHDHPSRLHYHPCRRATQLNTAML